MPSVVYFVACTIDGYVAARDGSIDAFSSDPRFLADLFERLPETCPGHLREPLGVTGANQRFDAVIMGRRTYAEGLRLGVTDPYPTLATHVVSTTLEQVDRRVTLVSDEVPQLVERLKGGEGRDVWLAGGGTLAASMLDAGLVDELVVKVNPVVLGDGIGLFPGARPMAFEHVDTTPMPAGVQLVTYRPAGA